MQFRTGPIRVLVVEDSPTARELLVALFNQSGDIHVVGTAVNGEEAVQRTIQLRPDVVTMDIHMPRMDGLEATRQIMQVAPVPIVMVTTSTSRPDMDITFEAMRAGALTLVKKPGLADSETCERVIQTVRLMADVPVVHRWARPADRTATTLTTPPPATAITPPAISPITLPPVTPAPPPAKLPGSTTTPTQSIVPGAAFPPARIGLRERDMQGRLIVGIASSTGGPSALVSTLKNLPPNYPLPVLIVQHITKGFASSLVEWLNGQIPLRVRLAEQNEPLAPGTVYLSPDDYHMQVSDRGSLLLHRSPPYKGLRPSANYLFYSLARVYGRQAVGIILTGMGDDGVDGLEQLHQAGGLTLAQDEASCVVYGMPNEAVLRNAIDYQLTLDRISSALLQLPLLEQRG